MKDWRERIVENWFYSFYGGLPFGIGISGYSILQPIPMAATVNEFFTSHFGSETIALRA